MTISDTEPDWIAGGYFIGLRTDRTPYMAADLVPERVLSGSDCITPRAPSSWAIDWVTRDDDARAADAARFGLDDAGRARLMAWATAAIASGDLGWPDVLPDLAVARRVRAELLPPRADIVLFGLALPADLRDELLEDGAAGPQVEPGGVYRCIERGRAPAPGGVHVGFEILGWDMGGFHSSLCHGLERDYADQLGVELGPHGRPTTLADARRCADYTHLDTTGAEPALWLPWRFTEYPG